MLNDETLKQLTIALMAVAAERKAERERFAKEKDEAKRGGTGAVMPRRVAWDPGASSGKPSLAIRRRV